MTKRGEHPEPVILDRVFENKEGTWNASTKAVAQTDAQRVLEALVAENGIEGSISALDNQGFRGEAYRYLLKPLFQVAMERRGRV